MKPILIIRTGRAPDAIRARHGDFPHWFRLCAALSPVRLQVVDVATGESLPPPSNVAGALITGSAAMVTERAAWSERTAGWIRNAMPTAFPPDNQRRVDLTFSVPTSHLRKVQEY